MPPREWRLRIDDILEAIARIEPYTRDLDFEEFARDESTVDAVIRNFTVIGEAARHVPDDVISRFPEIPWRDMQDVRNIVVHEYFGVTERILWDTARGDLPPLVPLLRSIAGQNPP